MRRMIPIKLALAFLLAACVTVNVYFPAAEAEQAADRIIDSVTSQPASPQPQPSKPGESSPQSEPKEPRSSSRIAPIMTGEGSAFLAAAGRVLELLVPAAHAQANANVDISTPEIRAVTASMQQRFAQLQKYFAAGVIGLTADGLVDVRDLSSVPLAERATVKRLVGEDNRDRATLYSEIAKANGHPEWESDIRRTFARRWVERGAQPGWYYRDASGKWVQK